jgi:hypothetical protein
MSASDAPAWWRKIVKITPLPLRGIEWKAYEYDDFEFVKFLLTRKNNRISVLTRGRRGAKM